MKKIAILYNLNRQQFEYEAEFDSNATIRCIYDALKNNYKVYNIEADKNFSWIKTILKLKPDLVFNVCEGFYGPARESVYGAILEQINQNYSGPDSTNMLICHNKFLTKNILKEVVNTPKGYIIKNLDGLNNATSILYPAIVKLNSEGSSIGMSEKSIVYNYKDLYNQVDYLLSNYKRAVLVEEFIDGKDISMAYIEGIGALGPCEVDSQSLFYDYEMKTTKDNTVNIFGLDGNFSELKDKVNKIAEILDIKGYAKIDFRYKNNKYYLIEVNSQVSFHPQGEFMTCAYKEDYSFNDIINHIVKHALQCTKKINSIGWYIHNGKIDR